MGLLSELGPGYCTDYYLDLSLAWKILAELPKLVLWGKLGSALGQITGCRGPTCDGCRRRRLGKILAGCGRSEISSEFSLAM